MLLYNVFSELMLTNTRAPTRFSKCIFKLLLIRFNVWDVSILIYHKMRFHVSLKFLPVPNYRRKKTSQRKGKIIMTHCQCMAYGNLILNGNMKTTTVLLFSYIFDMKICLCPVLPEEKWKHIFPHIHLLYLYHFKWTTQFLLVSAFKFTFIHCQIFIKRSFTEIMVNIRLIYM